MNNPYTSQNKTNGVYQEGTTLRQEIIELNKNLSVLTKSNRKRSVIMRGLMNGIFTAIGASLGFALFLIGSSRFLQQAENIPIIDRIIEKTHLNIIINRYLEDLERPTPTPIDDSNHITLPSTTSIIEEISDLELVE